MDRDYFGAEWFVVRAPHDTDNLIPQNKMLFHHFLQPISTIFQQDIGHPERTEEQKHLIAELPLKKA